MARSSGKDGAAEVYVVTGVPESSLKRRRNRYMLMMFLRVLLVPGVLLLPVPGTVQALLVCTAAVTQLIAVIMANEPTHGGYDNPAAFVPPSPVATRGALPAPGDMASPTDPAGLSGTTIA